jgi:RNA ligase (TIGR02306 family)
MPSSTITQVLEIEDVRPHPDADRLELATLGGWQIVCGKGLYQNGERVVYITPDTLITEKLSDILEIKQHLSSVKNPDGTFVTNDKGETMLRVRQAKLRGEPSFGTTIPVDVMQEVYGIDINNVPLTANLAAAVGNPLGVMKYEPAMRASAGDAEEDHPLFVKYTSIENIRNYPNVFEEGELVTLTEKIHGTNCRVGLIEGDWMAGSHGLRRKSPAEKLDPIATEEEVHKAYATNTYWYPLSLEPVRNLLEILGRMHKQVILFGEVYGNVQKKYNYDVKNGIGFRAFDLLVDGKYAHAQDFIDICNEYKIPMVPIFQTMGYNYENITKSIEDVSRNSTLNIEHPMEGVVIKPVEERYDRRVGRVVLKYITNAYLFDNKKSDYTDV